MGQRTDFELYGLTIKHFEFLHHVIQKSTSSFYLFLPRWSTLLLLWKIANFQQSLTLQTPIQTQVDMLLPSLNLPGLMGGPFSACQQAESQMVASWLISLVRFTFSLNLFSAYLPLIGQEPVFIKSVQGTRKAKFRHSFLISFSIKIRKRTRKCTVLV